MAIERKYDLKLADGGTAEWTGTSGEDAARRYVDCFRDATVIATRLAYSEQFGVFVLSDARQIIG